MFAWIIGVLFAVWFFFRVIAQLVIWPKKPKEPSEWPMILLGYALAGLELVLINWWYGVP